jgi:hypothetical protein
MLLIRQEVKEYIQYTQGLISLWIDPPVAEI